MEEQNMKKASYKAPIAKITDIELQAMVCNTITGVGGNTDITIATPDDDLPDHAGARQNTGFWDD